MEKMSLAYVLPASITSRFLVTNLCEISISAPTHHSYRILCGVGKGIRLFLHQLLETTFFCYHSNRMFKGDDIWLTGVILSTQKGTEWCKNVYCRKHAGPTTFWNGKAGTIIMHSNTTGARMLMNSHSNAVILRVLATCIASPQKTLA